MFIVSSRREYKMYRAFEIFKIFQFHWKYLKRVLPTRTMYTYHVCVLADKDETRRYNRYFECSMKLAGSMKLVWSMILVRSMKLAARSVSSFGWSMKLVRRTNGTSFILTDDDEICRLIKNEKKRRNKKRRKKKRITNNSNRNA